MSELLILSEASKQTGLSAGHLGYLIRNGLIKGQRAGKFWMVDKASLDSYIAERKAEQARKKQHSDQDASGQEEGSAGNV